MEALLMHDENDLLHRRARREVFKLKGFYSHLFAYLAVMAGLVVINLLFTPGYYWFVWPLLGWGVGLLSHAAGIFKPINLFSKKWEARKIQEFVDKSRRP